MMAEQAAHWGDEIAGLRPRPRYVLTARWILRWISLVYLVAFSSLAVQVRPLFGEHGILPVARYLAWIGDAVGGAGAGFVQVPSIFWLGHSDPILLGVSLCGCVLAMLGLAGRANVFVFGLLWFLYLSVVHVGQTFYSYGWEYLLLEAGSLCCLLAPWGRRRVSDPRALLVSMVLFRWLVFRVMFGAGLIKWLGDPCWRDLSCLVSHFESQPNPHPISWFLHHGPLWVMRAGVLLNHFVELVVPFFVFGPRVLRLFAGGAIIAFQCMLIASGNLAFLNWLTIAVAWACLDDAAFLGLRNWAQSIALSTLRPLRAVTASKVGRSLGSLWQWAAARIQRWVAVGWFMWLLRRSRALPGEASRSRFVVAVLWALVVAGLSLDPAANLLRTRPRMNATYNRLHLVNSYGAFGSINKQRLEVMIEGSNDGQHWQSYEFPCKPGRTNRRPCLVTPFHYRLQWQSWFASFGNPNSDAWLVRFVYLLLAGEPSVKSLLEYDPFPRRPPLLIRVSLYRYRFTDWGESGWWKRERVGQWMRPVSVDDDELLGFLETRKLL